MSNRGVPEWFGSGEKPKSQPARKRGGGAMIVAVLAVVLMMGGGVASFLLMRARPQPSPAATETPVAVDPPPEPPPPPPPPPDLVPVAPPEEAAAPPEEAGAPPEEAADEAAGARSSADVRRSILLLQKELRVCYSNALSFAPDSEGKALIRLTVAPSGSVETARVTTTGNLPPTVGPCIEKVAKAARFSPASDKTQVSFPVSYVQQAN